MLKTKKRNTKQEYFRPRALEEDYVTLTDIKNWIYCPKIVYFNRVLKVKPLTETTQQRGKEFHKEEIIRMLRRKGIRPWERRVYLMKKPETELKSKKLQLKGKIDLIAMNEHGEIFPVEIKYMRSNKGKAWLDHKYQLVAEALLIEEHYRKPVKKGYIYYHTDRKIVIIRITKNNKEQIKDIIQKILQMIKTEKPPNTRIPKNRCTGGCGYKWICKQI